MTITWTKCSERMPPDDTQVIIRDSYGTHKIDGHTVNKDYWIFVDIDAEWTPYTPEAWAELNRK